MARILVVDDQKIPRATVSAILREAEHQVHSADSGEEGLARARDWEPDIIVLDVYMPGMDGFQVVERLKQDERTEPIPVIFLTAEPPTDELIVRGLDLGAYDFISKDCSRAELLARVGVMARIKRGHDELTAIARISDTLLQTLDPAELASRFVEQVSDIFRADGVLLRYPGDGNGTALLHAARGLDERDPLTETLADDLLDRLSDQAGGDAELDLDSLRGPAGAALRRSGFAATIAARVDDENRPPTLLAAFTRREHGFFRGNDQALLHLLARQAKIALDNAALHERTRRQARLMEEQAEQLEIAMSERSRFFASMSHELRTPINAVIGYNQLMEYGSYGPLTDEQREAVDKVHRSATHLLELINDILDISKIEAGKLEVGFEPTELEELVKDTVTSVQLQAEEKGLELVIDADDGPTVDTDPARVRQILLNLLSNAVKFTETGGIRVELDRGAAGADGPRDGFVEIRVIDTGPGVPEEDRERIFEEFEQTGDTLSPGGTGLGLAISRRLAALLGGELELRSTLGEGSTFTLRLPTTPPATLPASDQARNGESVSGSGVADETGEGGGSDSAEATISSPAG